jgi:hypothetical protein
VIIHGTARIRGVLDLPTIKKQLKANGVLPLNDIEFSSSDVQIALKMGYITATEDTLQVATGKAERTITLINNQHTPINIPNRMHPIQPGIQFTLHESELLNGDIRAAIAKGIIKILNASNPGMPSAGQVKIGLTSPVASQSVPETTKQPVLDTNEELTTPTRTVAHNVIDTETPEPINKEDIPDPLGKSVIFNPTGQNPLRIIKNATVAKTNGNKLEFVDIEQANERIEKHPKLNKKNASDDLELIDLAKSGRKPNIHLPPETIEENVEQNSPII